MAGKVFPAHAGMSQTGNHPAGGHPGFPRSRGDEPGQTIRGRTRALFSPLTRG